MPSVSCYFNKIPEINKILRRKELFWLTVFTGLNPWLLGHVAFRFVARQNSMVGACGKGWCLDQSSQEAKTERGGAGTSIPSSRTHSQWPNFLPLGPTSQRFHYLLIASGLAIKLSTCGSLRDIQESNKISPPSLFANEPGNEDVNRKVTKDTWLKGFHQCVGKGCCALLI